MNNVLMWWADLVPAMNKSLLTDVDAQLPADGMVWHYHPLGFMTWLNRVTWQSEWPKYRITDARGQAMPTPPRPPHRR
jgi:hypothetical protein